MAPRRQAGALGGHSTVRDALVAAAKSSLADQFPSAITGRSLARSAVLAVAFDELLEEYAASGTDEAGVPRPFGFRDNPTFWRALAHLMLDRATFDDFRPQHGVLARAVLGVQAHRPELDAEQAKAIVALGVAIDFGLLIHRPVLGRAAGLGSDEPAIDLLVEQWLEGLYRGVGPLGARPVASPNSPIRVPLLAGDAPVAVSNEAGTTELSAEDRLVDAGARLLEDRAPSAISGRQLARAAGVNYGLIHHYFGTKDEVLRRSIQLHRDRFFAANTDNRRPPGYFSVCDHPGYVRATTWAAIDPALSIAEQRFPVMDLLVTQQLDSEGGRRDELATRVAVVVVVSAQLGWALFGDLFEAALDAELVQLEALVAPLLHRLLQAPLLETEFSA